MVRIDVLTRRRQAGPPLQAALQGKRLVTTKVSAQRPCIQAVHRDRRAAAAPEARLAREGGRRAERDGRVARSGRRRRAAKDSQQLAGGRRQPQFACQGAAGQVRERRRANSGREIGVQGARQPC